MWYIIITLVLAIVGSAIWHVYDGWSSLPSSVLIVAIILLVSLVFSLVVVYYDNVAEIEKYQAIKTTVETARRNTLEGATILETVAKKNAWLAEQQYFNNTSWGIVVPNQIDELMPIVLE